MWKASKKGGGTFQVNADDISDWAEIHLVRHNQYDACTKAEEEHVGTVRFITDFPDQGFITIGGLAVEEPYRNRGVATALLAAVHADHPDHKISPGHPYEEGIGFIRHILEKEPVVRQAGALLHESVKDL